MLENWQKRKDEKLEGWNNGVREYWSDGDFLTPFIHKSIIPLIQSYRRF